MLRLYRAGHRLSKLTVVTPAQMQSPFLFVHIPKTAGTSFHALLSECFLLEEVAPLLAGSDPKFDPRNPKHRLFSGHYSVHAAESYFSDCVWLTFLREPISRSISQYRSWHDPKNLTPYWLARIDPEQRRAVELAQSLTFEEYLEIDNEYIRGSISNHQCRVLCSLPVELTVSVCSTAGSNLSEKVLESAKRNLVGRFNFFGLTERFCDSLYLFNSQFDTGVFDANHHRQLNISEVAEPELSLTARKRLTQLNGLDLELYHTAKLEFARRLKAQKARSTA